MKIAEHEDRIRIEEIIISCKFQQMGSVKIEAAIKSKLGITISRPTIDKHYKEHMNGECLSQEIEQLTRAAVMGADGGTGLVAPVVDMDKLEAIRVQYKDVRKFDSKIDKMRESMVLLMESNFNAFIEGKERLKPEYAKYLKDLEVIKKAK